MKILYFDMWSPVGHIVFNNIHLKALSQLGDVYTVFKEGYHKYDYPHIIHLLDVPSRFYVKGEGYYLSRLRLARMARWVWNRVSDEKWDYVILSSYDPLALFLSRRFRNAIVVDHNTIDLLDSRILGFPLRHLNNGIRHIVFNNYMKSRLNMMGFTNVSIVPHGFMPINCNSLSKEEERAVRQKYSLNLEDRYVFLPSLSRSSTDVIGQFIYNDDFNFFLKKNGLKLLTKSSEKRVSKTNIIIIEGYLPKDDYNYLFLNSSCNVLFYSQDFKYRTSGVLNECFANNVPCIISGCPALEEYLPFFNNKLCVFNSVEELKRSIISVLKMDRKNYYSNIEEIKDPLLHWKHALGIIYSSR